MTKAAIETQSWTPTAHEVGRVVFYVMNPKAGFSGGRYHSWMVAEAAAEMGWDVSIITTNVPPLAKDFEDKKLFPAHDKIKIHICKLMDPEPCPLPDIPCDVLVFVPHGDSKGSYYHNAVDFAKSRKARIAFLNFETPNWFNSLSPQPRDPSRWDGWRLVTESAAMVFSLAGEGTVWAKEFYDTAPPSLMFEHLWPGVNSRVADKVGHVPKEKRVLILTRFAHAEHKGGSLVPELFCEAMRGYTAVFMVGIGKADEKYAKLVNDSAAKFGITIELLHTISEEDKWREFKRASIVLFPSFFEGYGLPPTEAQYAGTPCIAFELPVLREVSGDGVIFVPPGDTAAMRDAITKVLGSDTDWSYLKEQFGPAGRFEDFAQRVHRLFTRAKVEGSPPGEVVSSAKIENIPARSIKDATPKAQPAPAAPAPVKPAPVAKPLQPVSSPNMGGCTELTSFPYKRHAIYLRATASRLVERWMRHLPIDAEILLLVKADMLDMAVALQGEYPQIKQVMEVPHNLENGAPMPDVSAFLGGDKCTDALMMPLPIESEPIQFLAENHQPKMTPHYNLFRALWRAGFRRFAIDSHAGTKYLNIPMLLDAFIDRHKGQRCFIVGNGPSLNKIDMSLIKDEITMGSNRCYHGYEQWGFEFTYWGLLDRLQVEEYGPEYEANIPAATPKFYPFDYVGLLDFENSCPVHMNWDGSRPFGFSGTPDKLRLGFTVTNMMMQIAVIMGCSPIILIGCDHNYKINLDKKKNARIGTERAQVWTADDAKEQTHFTEKYTAGPGEKKKFIPPRPERMDEAFDVAQKWCKDHGVEVYNATPGTGLLSFPLVDYNDLFDEETKAKSAAAKETKPTLPKAEDFPRWSQYPRDLSDQMKQRIACAERGAPLQENDGKIAALKDIHKGKTAWLLGNGPSVRPEDLELLKDEIVFGCNRLYLAYKDMKFRPTYLCSTDEQMINDFGQEMVDQHPGKVLFTANTPPKIKGDFVWFQMGSRTPLEFSANAYDYIMPGGGTLITALQIGFHMGITRFNIYGMDHNFTFKKDEAVDHYKSATGDDNHFIKDYRSGKAWAPPVLWQVEGALLSAQVFLQQHGGWIKNATHGGQLEVLERIPFKDALKTPGGK